MAASRSHLYRLQLQWTGNTGSGTSSYTSYSRNHQVGADGRSETIHLSSDPEFRGDASRYNPEQLLVASLSSCHMLWFLHLCSVAGIVVTDYSDAPVGTMQENQDGSGEFREVTLHPRVVLLEESRNKELPPIHHRAHELCFISRSVNFPVNVQPVWMS